MSQTVTISIESKAKLFEFQKLFKASPASITPEIRIFTKALNTEAWNIGKDTTKTIEERNSAFDIIKICHEILGQNFKEEWRPREGKKQFTKRVITVEERQANCDAFVKYLASRNLEDPTVTVDALAKVWSGSY